jgi:archaellum biogenesis ATPase FlaH
VGCMLEKITSGVEGLDRLLGGGWPTGKVSIIYGPRSSLKTMICLATAKLFSSKGYITIYIETEFKTGRDRVGGFVYLQASEVSQLLEQLIAIRSRLRFLNPRLVLVVIDSLTAPLHHLQLQYPQYASEKARSISHVARQICSDGATILATSWIVEGGYTGRWLDPAVVLRTWKVDAERLLAVLEKSDGTLLGYEELRVEEVVEAAAV